MVYANILISSINLLYIYLMLNILKEKKKETLLTIKEEYGNLYGKIKDIIPADKEWYNSIYMYNKNSLKLLPIADNVVSNIIKSYFYMFYNQNKRPRRRYLRAIRYSACKIWVSKPEIKHINNKLTITLYIYNREYNYLNIKVRKLLKNWNIIINRSEHLKKNNEFNDIMLRKLPKNKYDLLKKDYIYLINIFHNIWEPLEELKQEQQDKLLLDIRKTMPNILVNIYKFKYYIWDLKDILENLYNKNVKFNLVYLKNFYLNSDILSQIITAKIRKRKNRAVRVISACLRKITTPVLNERTVKRIDIKIMEQQNLIIRYLINNKNYLNLYVSNKGKKWLSNLDLEVGILNRTKYKLVNGITLKASGRITRRIIAERAISNIRSIGTLKNVNTSFKGLSSVMVRGFKKSNIDSTLLWSKTHVGAFGLKGWISSY